MIILPTERLPSIGSRLSPSLSLSLSWPEEMYEVSNLDQEKKQRLTDACGHWAINPFRLRQGPVGAETCCQLAQPWIRQHGVI